ncbi:unknown protein [Waddlia chondrophila 2032/99]|uniref:Uncharacterized protein n=1 Tax=Waddlia chondrophila 2032/99 TaxID=765953 RepID=F8LC35_9BACT|nr:unknown protein [Waddlia chondrophila 2032/99]
MRMFPFDYWSKNLSYRSVNLQGFKKFARI